MGAGENKPQYKVAEDEAVVVDDEEVDDVEVVHHLRREVKELREENQKVKKEVEDINAERVHLRREK